MTNKEEKEEENKEEEDNISSEEKSGFTWDNIKKYLILGLDYSLILSLVFLVLYPLIIRN